MKTNHWLVLGTLLATSAVAQVNTNNLWAVPPPLPPMTNAPVVAEKPAALPVKKTVHHKKRTPAESGAAAAKMNFSEPMITLVPGPAEIIVSNVNVRGQAGLKGEVVAHVKVGDTVTVLSQINLDKHKADEPAQWAKILLPASTKIWVNAEFIEPTSKTVRPKKLNLRAGPSEDYSVLGVIERGTPVSEIITRNGWMQIETPTNAYGFLCLLYTSDFFISLLTDTVENQVGELNIPAPPAQADCAATIESANSSLQEEFDLLSCPLVFTEQLTKSIYVTASQPARGVHPRWPVSYTHLDVYKRQPIISGTT